MELKANLRSPKHKDEKDFYRTWKIYKLFILTTSGQKIWGKKKKAHFIQDLQIIGLKTKSKSLKAGKQPKARRPNNQKYL